MAKIIYSWSKNCIQFTGFHSDLRFSFQIMYGEGLNQLPSVLLTFLTWSNSLKRSSCRNRVIILYFKPILITEAFISCFASPTDSQLRERRKQAVTHYCRVEGTSLRHVQYSRWWITGLIDSYYRQLGLCVPIISCGVLLPNCLHLVERWLQSLRNLEFSYEQGNRRDFNGVARWG